MKRKLLALSLCTVLACALASHAAAQATAKPAPSDSQHSVASNDNENSGANDADKTQARHELDQMRDQMRDLSRRMAELSTKLGDVGPRTYAYRYIGDPDRAMIGVVFDGKASGVSIAAVTPGSPAEKAGIKVDDIVTAIDGKSVTIDKTHPRAGLDQAREALGNMKVGATSKLSLQRGDRKFEVTVKAERRESNDWARVMADAALRGETPTLPPDFERNIEIQVERAQAQAQRAQAEAQRAVGQAQREATRAAARSARASHDAMVHWSEPLWGLQLASVTPDLGSYFGSDKGVLVISAEKSLEPLKAGDILLSLSDQSVDRPEDVMRLLRDQPQGKKINMHILRQHKQQSLDMQVPEFGGMFYPEPPEAPEAPEPPEPAIAPAAPAAPHAPSTVAPAPPAPPVHTAYF